MNIRNSNLTALTEKQDRIAISVLLRLDCLLCECRCYGRSSLVHHKTH